MYRPPIAKLPNAGSVQDVSFAESRVNGGMITSVDAADIPTSALTVAKNVRVRYDKTFRRAGHTRFTPNAPNLIRVLKVATLKDNHSNAYTFRMTPSSIHRLDGGAWTNLTPGAGGILGGGVNDRYRTVVINNRFVFSNNGAGVIQEIDPIAGTYKALGNAPRYKFITGFHDRVVGANRTSDGIIDSNGVEIGWSATGSNIGQWDAGVNIEAGSSPLIISPSDFADYITGVFGLTQYIAILRERSVWLGTKQPIAANPFNFYSAVPEIGCDCPYSASPVSEGLAWFDTRTSMVWMFSPGSQPEAIGDSVYNEIIRNIDDPNSVFATYNPAELEYTVCVPSVGGIVKMWTYNLRTKTWVYDELPYITSLDMVDISSGYTSIDNLTGTIDSYAITIDQLSPAATIRATRMIGDVNGKLMQEDVTVSTDDGSAFESEIVSKNFEMPDTNMAVSEVRIDYSAFAAGSVALYVARDGENFPATPVKTFDITDISGSTAILRWKTNKRCRQFRFKLVTQDAGIRILKYGVRVFQVGTPTK
jgi:hypothetical protein